MTEYVVLSARPANAEAEEKESAWTVAGQYEARDARAAVAAHVNGDGSQKSGVFVAVPTRSWKRIEVAVETQTRLKFT